MEGVEGGYVFTIKLEIERETMWSGTDCGLWRWRCGDVERATRNKNLFNNQERRDEVVSVFSTSYQLWV